MKYLIFCYKNKVDELKMSAIKMNISEMLIEGYVKAPPSLKEYAITKLAIQLCQNIELKKNIIFESEELQREKHIFPIIYWDNLIEEQSTSLCERLHLPPLLRNLLIVRIWSIALQLFTWNRQQVNLNLSPLLADSLLAPSDWTVELKLGEKKIAERLVQDERIPVCQRYKMACFHCLELFIHSLWNQISTEHREDLFHSDEFKLVQLWTYKLSGKIGDLIPGEDLFWFYLLKQGVSDGSISTVLHCWDKLHVSLRQDVLIDGAAIETMFNIYTRINKNVSMYFKAIASPAPYMDILCFLITQMSKEQRITFFQNALQNTEYNVFICFLQWPYLDLLLPIINELWSILPEAKFEDLLFTLAKYYTDHYEYSIERNSYVDYYYGSLIIELLKEAPDHFKRYVFRENYSTDTNTCIKDEFLFVVIQKVPLKIQNIKIFQKVWQHVTLEGKKSFLRTEFGEFFCCFLALEGNWELLTSVLRECLPENDIAMFQKNILGSEAGKELCFTLLIDCNTELLNSFLNWGLPSKEIFQFILKIFFRDHRFDMKPVYDFEINIYFLYNVINVYAPSEDARKKFKSRFVKIYSKDVCAHLIFHSKWQELEEFLSWGFSSERSKKRFKTWFVREFAMQICKNLIEEENLKDAEQFVTWCFPSQEAAEQFRQELFFFSGQELQCGLLDSNSHDLDSLILWFKLSTQSILKFKKEFMIHSYSLNFFFSFLSKLEKHHIRKKEFLDFMLQEIALVLKWGLETEETAIGFKDFSKIYLMNFSFNNDEVRQWVERTWDKLIDERLSNLSTEQKLTTQV